jgi:hypothetical protein
MIPASSLSQYCRLDEALIRSAVPRDFRTAHKMTSTPLALLADRGERGIVVGVVDENRHED